METTDIMLMVISTLWTILFAIIGFLIKRVFEKLDSLVIHREDCISRFANAKDNQASHARIFEKLEDHERRLTRVETTTGART